MMKKASIITVLVLALFVVNVSAGPLNSFEQNPITYWNDLSTNIDVTWDSSEQTVKIGWANDSLFWEDYTVITDWTETNFEGNDEFVTDGDVMTFTTEYDAGDVYDRIVTNIPSITNLDNIYIRFNKELNETGSTYIENMYINIFDQDNQDGNKASKWFDRNTASEIIDIPLTDFSDWDTLTGIKSITIQLRAAVDKSFEWESDYFRIYRTTGDLDIGVPLTLQNQQTVELYVNSTFLNSEVRLEIYDDTEALDTYCVFNSSYVVFPDDDYAQTDGLARIEFSLDNERNTGTVTVFAENSTLINQYETSILSGTNFLRMIDSVFNGSIILYYLNGDTTYSAEFSIIEELFLSTGIVGYIGPLALILIGYVIAKKERILGVLYFVVECLFVAQYLELVEATPDYWWQIFLILIGGLFTCVYPLWDR